MEYVKIHRHLCSKEQILIFKSIKMLEIRCIQVIWRWNLVAEGWRERSMATNGLDPVERPKHGRLQSRQSWHIFWNAPVYREKGIKESPSSFQSFQALLQTEGIIKTLWTFRTTFCYHCKSQWFWEQWLGTTVELRVFFWRLWGQAAIGFNSIWWLSTMGQMMEGNIPSLRSIQRPLRVTKIPVRTFLRDTALWFPVGILGLWLNEGLRVKAID